MKARTSAEDFAEAARRHLDDVHAFLVYLTGDRVVAEDLTAETFAKALARVEVDPGWPSDLTPYMTHHAEILVKENKIKAVPDWSKALRTEFLKQASA